MEVSKFISLFEEAFGLMTELPIVFWYSDEQENETEKVNGCFFKAFAKVKEGTTISLSRDTITCGGGKLYTGFSEMPERVPNFVSLKEKYKKTPEMVLDFINGLNWEVTPYRYLHFARVDKVDSFDGKEGILFFATPDQLSGLTTWCYFDTNREDAVSAIFGSGCSAVVTLTVLENRKGGKRTFLGLFDPSVRPHVGVNELSYAIPMSRFKEMLETMTDSCLFDTHAWKKVHERINECPH